MMAAPSAPAPLVDVDELVELVATFLVELIAAFLTSSPLGFDERSAPPSAQFSWPSRRSIRP